MGLKVQEAIEEGNDKDFTLACQEHHKAAMAYWKNLRGEEVEQLPAPDKRERKKAFAWLLAVDNMLKVMGLGGFGRYIQPKQVCERDKPENWPILSISIDQGSDGWTGGHYLLNEMRGGVLVLRDVSHRLFNDVKLACQDSHLWGSLLVLIICFNSDHGPWRDARWYQEGKTGAHLYIKSTHPQQCPFFAAYFDKFLAEANMEGDLGSEEVAQHLFNSIPTAF